MDPILVSVPEAAAALGIGITKTNKLIATGRLRTVKVDNRRLVPVAALTEFVESLAEPAL